METNIYPKNHPNVGKYTIHGAYMEAINHLVRSFTERKLQDVNLCYVKLPASEPWSQPLIVKISSKLLMLWQFFVPFIATAWWFHLKNDGVRQLGWWHSQLIWKNKIHVPNHQPGKHETIQDSNSHPVGWCRLGLLPPPDRSLRAAGRSSETGPAHWRTRPRIVRSPRWDFHQNWE